MLDLIEIILPVFLVVGFGYVAVWQRLVSEVTINALMGFAQKIAIPFLLFRAISTLDLGDGFQPALLISFYTGAVLCFAAGIIGSRFLFKRDWEDSVAIGFACLFSNSVLLGLPISERAFGPDNLSANYAIIAFHAPVCYGVGITTMEIIKAKGAGFRVLVSKVASAMFKNALILGILAGVAVNVSTVSLPVPVTDAIDLIVRTALPTALFGLGGILYRYRPEGDFRIIAMVCCISLILHPVIVYTLGSFTGLSKPAFRSMVITSAMAPGINAYLFADMYGRARRVAASSVLLSTALCVITAWVWLGILG
ncbi:MAG: AEC family transporter [Paracoccaceae bacterium]|nr:AEC family transporter [Paracoccaceae bacterium]MDG2259558.1 AEC family transporter [Paracoccaceae bacterium]